MNSSKNEDIPSVNIERNPLVLLISAAITALFIYLTYSSIFSKEAHEVNPMGFFLFVPTVVISYQTLWLLLNPYAIIYENKMEMKRTLFSNKEWQFVDLMKVSELQGNSLKIVYNDNEVEKISLFGIKPSHKSLMRQELDKHIAKSLQVRA